MSTLRLEVPCYGGTTAVLSARRNPATGARYWMAEIYCQPPRSTAIQLLVICGSDDAAPRFEVTSSSDGVRHCLWLMHSCIELPLASWKRLKALAADLIEEHPSHGGAMERCA
ncbi:MULTISPECIES: hypothetical protein [Xanthomonas]|uniref:Uncharacterized protein n=2 Tax=Xanthomonas citri TaxID=346 RepID=A0AB33CNQ1_XANCI|nr:MULTISPECIES: hypothetical protein [Xanthomonas]MBV6780923.1 hypothetical protein [Xanthomonas campestris pv. trichodesmae]ASK91843.1 hypothetical protein XcvCFBP7111P_10290 [Xanthomonas citri pv. vignicola]MBV6788447.1 hypothetical protein [Xanthomonas campestris pv. clerodendri]MBZ3919236.1 hypothetical protein [Xanthomonas campestris pv. trichodesmae]MBZ3922883.1 hypothetical protein [Xanthomonas citri pv. sesbaniae]